MNLEKKILIGCVVIVVALLGYLYFTGGMQNNVLASEPSYDEEAFTNAPADSTVVESQPGEGYDTMVDASEPLGENEQPSALQQDQPTTLNQLPSECYPKDVLSSADLLPQDANSLYAQVNPSGQGSLQDQNFLTAGYHIGINTVGQSLRNANRQLRSEPPNPQVKVSPWQQTTIEPDINRRPLEIAGEQ